VDKLWYNGQKKRSGRRKVPDMQALERLLIEQKLSLQKVSDLTGVSPLALEYMVYKQMLPKRHIAQKIAKALNVKVEDIWPQLDK
jgi:lambda repressor-like predicted transcriptional regulator